MSPDFKYSELATMKNDEIFIEWAIIVKRNGNIKLPVRKIIKKADVKEFKDSLRKEYKVTPDLENVRKHETVELLTIEK